MLSPMRLIAPLLAAGLNLALAAGSALAAPAPSTPPVKEVSPVTVFPKTDAPKVVRTYPAAGQAMSAGVLVVSVTFDQSMLKTGFDFGPAADGETPRCLKTPRLLDDNKTFVLLCTTEPHKSYALTFNAKPEGGFENVAEHRAERSTLAFSTTDGDGPRDIHEAMKAANLREIDMPIQDAPQRRDGNAGP